jgi:hypothetical protein
MKSGRMSSSRIAALFSPFALAGVMACGPSEEVQRQLAELQAVSAEKDSLLTQVSENARLMSEISAEVARVQTASQAGAQEVSGQPNPEAVRENIAGITRRIEESEARLAESQKRIQTLTRENRTNQTKLAELQKTIEDFQATIANQRLTIESLNTQVTELQQQNVQLVTQNTELATTVEDITVRENTVYYVIGTKEELLEKGIIEEEGGSRVLFVFGKRGKTLVPGRNLDLSLFNSIDRTTVTGIPMPSPEAAYTIVTRQDHSALATPPDEKGRFMGEIRIADPERFWASSKVLIVVQS